MAQELTVENFINNEVVKKCLNDLKDAFPPGFVCECSLN